MEQVVDIIAEYNLEKNTKYNMEHYTTIHLVFKGHTLGAKKGLGFDEHAPLPFPTTCYAVVFGKSSHKSTYEWNGWCTERKAVRRMFNLLATHFSKIIYFLKYFLYLGGGKSADPHATYPDAKFGASATQGTWAQFSVNNKEKPEVGFYLTFLFFSF